MSRRHSLYATAAADAVQAERAENWPLAATLWTDAAGYARRQANQAWAGTRAGFCQAMHERTPPVTPENGTERRRK